MRDSNELIEKIARRLKCYTCGRRYRSSDFRVIEEREQFSAMLLSCRECHKQSLVFAVVERRRVRSVFSELDAEEWARYRNAPPVNHDDVIQMHRQMQTYAGDFAEVLEDPLPPGEWAD